MSSGVNPQPPVRRGFWSPLWEAGPRLRESIVHDPVRRTRIKTLLIGEVTILISVLAVDWFVRCYAIPFDVWTCSQTWVLLLTGLWMFVLSYAAPIPQPSALQIQHFQRAFLLILLWLLSIELLGAVLLVLTLSFEARPHFFWASSLMSGILHFIHRTGLWGMSAVCIVWLGFVYAGLFSLKKKWQRDFPHPGKNAS